MTKKPDIKRAQQTAAEVLLKHNLKDPPIDPKIIAQREGIEVRPYEKLDTSFSGCLLRKGQAFGIGYSSAISSEGFRRFTIAHELGHYFLTHQHEFIFPNGGPHFSTGNFISYDWFEVEADHFASELLIPENLLNQLINKVGLGLPAIKKLSDIFKTSLTSTAIKYAQSTYDPTAIIVSEGPNILYCFTSESLNRIRGIQWEIRKNDPLPRNSATARFNQDRGKIERAETVEDMCHISEWFPNCKSNLNMNEDIAGLGTYNKTLTVLFTKEIPEEDEQY